MARARGSWRRVAAFVALALVAGARADDYEWRLPRGLPEPAVPADNPMNEAKVALGAELFADTRLSASGRHSCASCHSPALAFTDGLARSGGVDGDVLPLNAPTLLNVAYQPSLGWNDPAVRTLERQMDGPLFNTHPRELGLAGREATVERMLSSDGRVAAQFAAAFPGEARPVTIRNVVRAIAAYERTLVSAGSPFDRYVFGGDTSALSPSQKRGMALFFSARTGCAACHGGILFSGPWVDRDHPDAEPAFADTGSGVKVRVPTLRNVARTGPYLHDGRRATLEAVLDGYETLARGSADPRLVRPPLTTDELDALRDFLVSLSDAP
jgi:cytochrome c peroxidase